MERWFEVKYTLDEFAKIPTEELAYMNWFVKQFGIGWRQTKDMDIIFYFEDAV